MSSNGDTAEPRFLDAEDISDRGERVSHLVHDANFYSHLSIYDYAVQFCQGAAVLDAGCGAGYGTSFLAERGARFVWGVDASAKAIEFCRHHFQRPNLKFDVMELQHLRGFEPRTFDFVFSSQALEHVLDVADFVKASCLILKPGGLMLACVPTITDDRFLYMNVTNPYHVNLWTPRQWDYVLRLYFKDVQLVLHGVRSIGQTFRPEDFGANQQLTEKDFAFKAASLNEVYKTFSLNAIFLVSGPRDEKQIPGPGEPLKFVDESFSRPAGGGVPPEIMERLKPYYETKLPLITYVKDPLRRTGRWERLRTRLRKILQ
jgi:SAM-dependent methyltransferase